MKSNEYKLIFTYQHEENDRFGMVEIMQKNEIGQWREVFTVTAVQLKRWDIDLTDFNDDSIIEIRLKMEQDSNHLINDIV